MKVTDWRRKLAASLVAGGLIAPAAAKAENLNTNLIANPGFESVDLAVVGDYNAPKILNWSGINGFAYSHNPGVTGIPDYADGADPPNAGNWYFTANNNPGSATGDIRTPNLVYQDLNVSAGPTGSQIATGEAAFKLSANMSSYLDDSDAGNVQVDFKNGGGTIIGSALISDPDFGPDNVWSQTTKTGLVPVGTATIRASIFGTPRNGGADGYIDLVDVQVTQAQNELMFLEVNTVNGQTKIRNLSGKTFHIDEYTIVSPGGQTGDYNNNGVVDAADYVLWRKGGTLQNDPTPGVQPADYGVWRANFGKQAGSLNPTSWTSLQDQNLAGFPAGNGTGNGWEEDGGSRGSVLSESYLTGNSTVISGQTVNLGAAFNVGSPHNLEFRYSVVPDNGLGQFTGPGELVQGFVRYVTLGAGTSTSIPEPASVIFVGIGLATLGVGGRTTARTRKL